jgi:CO/xanthine dehydrogenase Mo-binding subunit
MTASSRTLLGTRLQRRVDPALLTAEYHHVADRAGAGPVHTAIMRSPHAHVRIKGTDLAFALGTPGVAVDDGNEVNAIIDALIPYGIKDLDMPANPEKIWRALEQASQRR